MSIHCEAIQQNTGEPCQFKVCEQSKSGKYCGRHLKFDNIEKEVKKVEKVDDPRNVNVETKEIISSLKDIISTFIHCEAIQQNTGKPCQFKVSEKSKSGKYCGRHLNRD